MALVHLPFSRKKLLVPRLFCCVFVGEDGLLRFDSKKFCPDSRLTTQGQTAVVNLPPKVKNASFLWGS